MKINILPTKVQSLKLVVNNHEEFFTAKQCFDLIEFFKGLGWDVENQLVIYQSNMSNTIGGPIKNIDTILLRTHDWLYPTYGKEDLDRHKFKYRSNPSESQREFPWEPDDLFRLFDNIRPHYYLSYNGQLRPHRQFILMELFKRDIIKKGLVSCLNTPNGNGLHTNDCKVDWTKPPKDCCGGDEMALLNDHRHGDRPQNYDSILDFLKIDGYKKSDLINKEFTKSIPMILDLQAAPDSSEPTDNFKLKDGEFYPHRTSDVNHFKNSYFSLVTESNFLSDDVDERNDYNGECMFITEKTYRALCFHPTIIAGNHSTLKYLQSLGFETFHGFFNEEYDDEPDDHKRMLMVVNEVERICNIPKKQVHEMAKNAFPKVLHNQEIMKKFGDPDWAYAKLGEAYEELLFSKLTNSELFNNYFISR